VPERLCLRPFSLSFSLSLELGLAALVQNGQISPRRGPASNGRFFVKKRPLWVKNSNPTINYCQNNSKQLFYCVSGPK
jgi:hypothetical protein